jgi:hypothetical protein
MTNEQSEAFVEWMQDKGFEVTSKGTVYDRGRRKYDASRLVSLWSGDQGLLKDRYFTVDEKEVRSLIQEVAEAMSGTDGDKKTQAELIKEARDNFRCKLDSMYSVQLYEDRSFQYISKTKVGKPTTIGMVARDVRGKLLDSATPCPCKEDCVEIASAELDSKKDKMIQDALLNLKYDPELKFSFRKFTEKLFEYYKIQNTPLNRKMFKHMMHHIKRAAFYHFVEQKFWYLFFSRIQGIGKSRFVAHLAKPFVAGYITAELSQLMDPNDKKALFTCGAVLVDFKELGLGKGAKDADMSPILKKVQEEEVLSSRQMYQDSAADTLCFAVLASSTNLRIEEVIPDNTGYRRFFSFDIGLTVEDRKKYNATNKWQEIDKFWEENLVSAYRKLNEEEEPVINDDPDNDKFLFSELCEVQDGYALSVDVIQQWFNESGIQLSDTYKEGFVEQDLSYVYRKYNSWATTNNTTKYSRPGFQTALSGKKSIRTHKGEDKKDYYWFKSTEPSKR